MKNSFLLIFASLLSLSSYSQAETELLGIWYLHYRTENGATIYPPQTEQENYQIILDFGLLPPSASIPFTVESYGPETDTFEGRFTVDNGLITFVNVSETSDDFCNHPPEVCDYFSDYNYEVLFDENTSTEPNEYVVGYEVSGEGNDEGLTITNNFRGDIAVYGKQALSIQENTLSEIKLLKNPTRDFLSFNIINDQEVVNMKLFDFSGKLVIQRALETEIYIGNLSDGIYLLELSNISSIERKIFKLIKN